METALFKKGDIVIHIGYHKAASSLLQDVFSKLPVNYLWLAGEDFRRRELIDYVERLENFDAEAFRLKAENSLRTRKYKTTLISHEELSGHPHGYASVNPFAVAENLKEAFKNAKILIIIRNQFDYVKSLYSFRVGIKGSETRSFKQFIAEEFKKGLEEKLKYDKLVKRYIDLFGEQNVLTLPMELLKNDEEAFFRKIFELIGLDFEDYKELPLARKINRSSNNLFLLNFWRKVNAAFNLVYRILKPRLSVKNDFGFRYAFYHLKRRTTYLMEPIVPTKKIVESDFTKKIFSQYRETNRFLSQTIGIDLKKFNYPV